jgi:hypothetical protein
MDLFISEGHRSNSGFAGQEMASYFYTILSLPPLEQTVWFRQMIEIVRITCVIVDLIFGTCNQNDES